MILEELLVNILRQYPALDGFRVEECLKTSGQRRAYLLNSAAGRFVLKITDPQRAEEVVKCDTGILEYLGEVDFPSPRLIHTRSGQAYLPLEDRFLYVSAYLPGKHPKATPEYYSKLGQLMARLHSLPFPAEMRRSQHRPKGLLEEVRGQLNQAMGGDAEQRWMAEQGLKRVEAFPDFSGLPEGIIHTDPYFVNVLEDGAGSLALIDWEDGGISYPLMDVGYIGHLVTFLAHDRQNWQVSGEGEITFKPEWAQLFLRAYQQARPLNALERELLPAAIQLNFLMYLWDWDRQRLIPENFRRMQWLEEFASRLWLV